MQGFWVSGCIAGRPVAGWGTAGGQWGVARVHECEGLTSKKIILCRNNILKVLGHYNTSQFQKKAENVKKIASKNGKTSAVRTVLFIEG